MDKDTPKPKEKYSQLTQEEREEIAIGLEKGESQRSIARRLGRAPSSLSREIRRNNDTPVRAVRYRAAVAHRRAEQRKRASHQRPRLAAHGLRAFVETKLKAGWTPQAIAGRLPAELPGMKTNYESIYLWIYQDRPDLVPLLVRNHKKRHKRPASKRSRVGRIPGRADISQRPAVINSRSEAGHWEADTVVSRSGKHAVAVFVERTSRMYFAIKMRDKSAREMYRATVKALGRLPRSLVKSITFDNGLENALHEKINTVLGTKSYFCRPYHSWEKGGIENRNGILRRYFPKKHNWELTSQRALDKVILRINSTPMKCLQFRTPAEVFASSAGVAFAS